MSVDPHSLLAPLTALERALRTAHAELADQATARRRDADALAATWTGGHRERFDDDGARLATQLARHESALGELVVLVRRALDDLAAAGA